MKKLLPILLLFLSVSPLRAEMPTKVSDSWGSIKVVAGAPIPSEITNETQAQAVARDAAVMKGQSALLAHVLKKRAHSKRPLSEAEILTPGVQQSIRGWIKGARVEKTQWFKDECRVTLSLDKKFINEILSKN